MARSEYRTWLSLDEWATIIGINPLNFNQLASNSFPQNNVCGDIFFQMDWQHSDRIGRDTIAMYIQQAEDAISREVGYNLMPDWTLEERLPYPRPSFPESFNLWGVNPRGMFKSVELRKGHVISGGTRAKTAIIVGTPYVRSDDDADGFLETCRIITATTVTDANEIHLYYPGHNGEDAWEIRPIKVSIGGGNATIIFKIWQVAAENAMDTFDIKPLDADVAGSYETVVDVYRVYNDPSVQLQFLWENDPSLNCCGSCVACQMSSQYGCFHLRDERLGFIVPAPGTWNTTDQQFDGAEWDACREPDQVKVWYYSGWRDQHLLRPYAELSPRWKRAIAFYAASLFEREVCGCSNVNQFIGKWRRDAAFSSMQEGGFSVTPDQAANKLGTSMGALYAWREIQRNGEKVNK